MVSAQPGQRRRITGGIALLRHLAANPSLTNTRTSPGGNRADAERHSIQEVAPRYLLIHTASAELYTLSLHDALPICRPRPDRRLPAARRDAAQGVGLQPGLGDP